jgi:transposase-like protein
LNKKELQTEVKFSQGRSVEQLCRELSMTEQTYYCWRREYGGMKIAQARRLEDLEKENTLLKKAVADLTLDKLRPSRDTTESRQAPTLRGAGPGEAGRIRAACLSGDRSAPVHPGA